MTRYLSLLSALLLASLTALAPAAHAAPRSSVYVALGDSYSAGVGAAPYERTDRSCRRSTRAYPRLWAAAHPRASFTFAACAGAGTRHVLDRQLGRLGRATRLVTITVGGNDAGFRDTMRTCVLHGEKACLARVAKGREDVRNRLPRRLDLVYDAIERKAPAAEVVVMGYPPLYELGGRCLIGLTERSRRALNNAADDLNDVTAKRAADHGFTFGDVRDNFTGHGICSGDPWIHSVTLPIADSYHPTVVGQARGYYAVLKALT